jgi:hypothetical protein
MLTYKNMFATEFLKVFFVTNRASRHEGVWVSGGIVPRVVKLNSGWK